MWIMALPPIARKLDAKVKVSTLVKIVIITVLFFAGGMLLPASQTPEVATPTSTETTTQ